MSYRDLDGELLQAMWRAGFRQLNLALVSMDDRVRKSLGRPHTLAEYGRVIDAAVQIGFRIVSLSDTRSAAGIARFADPHFGFQRRAAGPARRFRVLPHPRHAPGSRFSGFYSQQYTRARSSAMAIETERCGGTISIPCSSSPG
jgi:hypothetical protein